MSPPEGITTRIRAWPRRRYALIALSETGICVANSRQAPPLYLHVTSTTKEGLEKAIEEINELMKQDLPNLIDERRFRRRDQPEERPQVERDSLGRRKWPEERLPIDLEPVPGFNLRANVVGTGGANVKWIQGETRCRVQIKGRGSGFFEHDTGLESDEQMYLHIACVYGVYSIIVGETDSATVDLIRTKCKTQRCSASSCWNM